MANDRAERERHDAYTARADEIDGGVRALLDRLDLTRTDAVHDRTIDALMGVSRAADALRALAAGDIEAANEASRSMHEYARKALDQAGNGRKSLPES
jgi:hypothetical protein